MYYYITVSYPNEMGKNNPVAIIVSGISDTKSN